MQNTINILSNVLYAAEKKNYSGYSKFDALNSELLRKISFNNKWLRLIYTQLINQSPFHVRPLFHVKVSRNPKGIALFARAYLFLYEKTANMLYLSKAKSLLQWLLDNPSPGMSNLCWGYNFIWQNTIFLQNELEPNAVVTVFVGEAFVHAYRLTKNNKYLHAARSVAEFILKDLPVIHEGKNERAIAYVLREVDAVVLNNQILTGAFLVKLWNHTKENELIDIATRLMNYTTGRVTPYGAWYYTHPPKKSPITHDNYHTGGILDGLIEYYEETGDDRYMNIYYKGLQYYQKHLFRRDGAPRWMHNKKFPADIHGSAQGIITFTKAARHNPKYFSEVEKIYHWAIHNLYRVRQSDFVYRQGRYIKWNYSLMRWCNAWMARAMGEIIVSL